MTWLVDEVVDTAARTKRREKIGWWALFLGSIVTGLSAIALIEWVDVESQTWWQLTLFIVGMLMIVVAVLAFMICILAMEDVF